MQYCHLPTLDENALIGGHVMSHDQVEAVLMRRAGFEVRVVVDEGASFEANPPTLVEFIRRDLRWCQGNMQYWHLLRIPRLKPVSRYQLVFAIVMFIGSPAWIGLLLIGALAVAMAPGEFVRSDIGIPLAIAIWLMWFAPNFATAIDVITKPHLWRAFGGGARFILSAIVSIAFVMLLQPIMWASHALFLVQVLFGRTVGWGAQARDDHAVPWSLAVKNFWPQTLVGLAPVLLLAATAPAAIPWALLIAGGPLLSIPFAVLTAKPAVGRALIARALARLPEETAPPPELRALALPAIELAAVTKR
jgi:membrane glycosyltransferase